MPPGVHEQILDRRIGEFEHDAVEIRAEAELRRTPDRERYDERIRSIARGTSSTSTPMCRMLSA